MADISNNIKRLRSSLGMSQTQLAENVGVTRQTVSNWEKGVSNPDIRMLEQLANALHCDVDDLLYPALVTNSRSKRNGSLSCSFVIISVLVYFFLLTVIGGNFVLPLFQKLFGGGIEKETLYLIMWGLILLVAFIAVCVCIITSPSIYEEAPDKDNDKNASE
ncbi:MAG: helix-turn-helix transcriptional regulator [Lachnospiraceae bacterium]|nr:helix-turn-helix transcriptional regulator [Lachnospiraceae bacterium]